MLWQCDCQIKIEQLKFTDKKMLCELSAVPEQHNDKKSYLFRSSRQLNQKKGEKTQRSEHNRKR